MRVQIRKIHPPQYSISGAGKYKFIRVEFMTETGKFALTDLCPTFRNFKRWRPLLKVGNTIEGVRLLGNAEPAHIDADSEVKLCSLPFVPADLEKLVQATM